jgi:hypothetical protein
MAKKWNETEGVWDPENGLLDDEQISRCTRADAESHPRGPIPTRVVSNGEYMPGPQTSRQKHVEVRVDEIARKASRRLGIGRRQFLAGTGGMAASLLAMNEVYGAFFKVRPEELYEPAAYFQNAAPGNMFVFDTQLHLVRGSAGNVGGALRALAQGPSSPGYDQNPMNPQGRPDENGQAWGVWNPALVGLPSEAESFQIVRFIKDVYLDSQVNVGILTNVTARVISVEGGPPRPPRNVGEALGGEMLTAAQTAAARDFVNEISGSQRMLAHGLLYVGRGNLDYIQEQIDENRPDAWKGYNISNAAKRDDDPLSPMTTWRHDDEDVAYPTFELIQNAYERLRNEKPGFNNIGVHKGLAPGPPDPERGHPGDLPKAAADWPGLNFVTYHSCIQPSFFMHAALEEIESGQLRDGVPDISWTTEYAQLVAPFPNCYAELGTTWASTVITFPTVAAHVMGQLVKYLGPDRVVFGSDSVWYGSPQWQIDAFWRFQIPEEMRERYGYPELSDEVKRQILGLNSARMFGIEGVATANLAERFGPVPENYESRIPDDLKRILEFEGFQNADNLGRIKERYVALNVEPDHMQRGWVRTRA